MNLTRTEATQLIRNFTSPKLYRTLIKIASQYLQIFILVISADLILKLAINSVWLKLSLTFLILLIIGARQYAILVLLHDGQHGLLSKNKKWNDVISRYFIAAPLLSFFDKSRHSHLAHHQHLGDPQLDPDYESYFGGHPVKVPFYNLIKYLLVEMTGRKLFQILSGKKNQKEYQKKAKNNFGDLLRIIYAQAVVILVFLLVFKNLYYYFLFWITPILTFALLFNQIRLFAEHSIPELQARKFLSDEILFTFESNLFERFFISPNNMNYHAEHHLFPVVPFYNLPKIRKIIQNCPELCLKFRVEKSYFSHVLKYFMTASHKYAS